MVYFFFYNKLKNARLINKISEQYEVYDGYIKTNTYDNSAHIITFNIHNYNLHGKVVDFGNLPLVTILKRINEIIELHDDNRKYTLRQVIVYTSSDTVCKATILY